MFVWIPPNAFMGLLVLNLSHHRSEYWLAPWRHQTIFLIKRVLRDTFQWIDTDDDILNSYVTPQSSQGNHQLSQQTLRMAHMFKIEIWEYWKIKNYLLKYISICSTVWVYIIWKSNHQAINNSKVYYLHSDRYLAILLCAIVDWHRCSKRVSSLYHWWASRCNTIAPNYLFNKTLMIVFLCADVSRCESRSYIDRISYVTFYWCFWHLGL